MSWLILRLNTTPPGACSRTRQRSLTAYQVGVTNFVSETAPKSGFEEQGLIDRCTAAHNGDHRLYYRPKGDRCGGI